jgi:glycosyltransferase involved in cell wall biosynthesis
MSKIGLSIIIPVYNSAPWIIPTLEHIFTSLANASFSAEIIVVDDGSSDGSGRVVQNFIKSKSANVTLITQKNTGRYLARKHGVEESKYENILFIDSRVYIDKGSLSYLESELIQNSDQIWNGHVNIDKKGNIFARFWDAIVCIAWRRYFRKPKRTSFGIKDFDYYPKGTGFFYVPRKRLIEAMEYFEKNTNDLEYSSDDTLLIRYLAKRKQINLSPDFSCLYHGRSNLKSFLKHAYNRGQFFIDGFLRPGTRFFYPLIAVLLGSIALLTLLIIFPIPIVSIIAIGLVALAIGLFFGAIVLGIILPDAFSLGVLGVPFSLVYLAGLWRGVIRKIWNISR